MDATTGKAGIIRASDDDGSMTKLSAAVLDDLLYNIISDLVLQTHREEKIAKANTAAIRVEKLASEASESGTDSAPDVRIETDAAIFDDGKVYLKGNPLKTTKEILCPKCHLPRLFHPTDGKGARKPDPTILYCKKHPYIDKPNCDIYGQMWQGPGPGRGKKKKDMEKKEESAADRPANVLSFPSATCSKCKRCILVTRLNNHMGSCIGNSGRNASRAAAQKMGNGNSGEPTPPSSQKVTPAPGSRATSPRKRDVSEEGEDESESSHKKKKHKSSSVTSNPNHKKVILKTKNSFKKESNGSTLPKSSSNLSQEQKAEYDIPDLGSVEVPPKKSTNKASSPAKKLKAVKAAQLPATVKNGRDADGESESSGGTLSSPPQ